MVQSTAKETAKARVRGTTRTKPKSVVVSARKTRSATKDLAERATTAKPSVENPAEHKRKTRKRKQSRSIDRAADSTDDENESISTNDKKQKTKRRKKSNPDRHRRETSNDETEKPLSSSHRSTTSKRKTRAKEPDRSEDERETRADSSKRKKSKVRRNGENETTKNKKGKTRRNKSPSMFTSIRPDEQILMALIQEMTKNNRSIITLACRPVSLPNLLISCRMTML